MRRKLPRRKSYGLKNRAQVKKGALLEEKMKEMGLVSIVMPNYNCEKYIKKTILL